MPVDPREGIFVFCSREASPRCTWPLQWLWGRAGPLGAAWSSAVCIHGVSADGVPCVVAVHICDVWGVYAGFQQRGRCGCTLLFAEPLPASNVPCDGGFYLRLVFRLQSLASPSSIQRRQEPSFGIPCWSFGCDRCVSFFWGDKDTIIVLAQNWPPNIVRFATAFLISFSSDLIVLVDIHRRIAHIIVCAFRIIRKLTTFFVSDPRRVPRHWCAIMPFTRPLHLGITHAVFCVRVKSDHEW